MTKQQALELFKLCLDSIQTDYLGECPVRFEMRVIDDGSGPQVDWFRAAGVNEQKARPTQPTSLWLTQHWNDLPVPVIVNKENAPDDFDIDPSGPSFKKENKDGQQANAENA